MAQLKINDLSVGDWVEFHRTKGIYIALPLFEKANARVIGTHRGAEVSLLVDGKREFIAMPLSAILPIPITPEILDKNGFEVYDDTARLKLDRPYALWLFKVQEGWDLHLPSREQHINLRIEHIHQLQHALRLAGVEKEIEL